MTRPQPVTDAATTASIVQALVAAAVSLAVGLGLVQAGDASVLTGALAALGTAGITVVGIVVGILQARHAATLVTPLAAPQDNLGRPLVPDTRVFSPDEIRSWGADHNPPNRHVAPE